MQLKKSTSGSWDVYRAGKLIGLVRRVNQNPAYGRGSADVLVWAAFLTDNRRIGMDFRTRRAAMIAVERAYDRLAADAEHRWRPEDYVAG